MPHCELHYDLCWVSWEPHSVSPLQGKDMGTMLQDSRNHYVGFHRRTSNNSRASFSSGYVKEIGRFTRHVALVLYSPLLLGWQLRVCWSTGSCRPHEVCKSAPLTPIITRLSRMLQYSGFHLLQYVLFRGQFLFFEWPLWASEKAFKAKTSLVKGYWTFLHCLAYISC